MVDLCQCHQENYIHGNRRFRDICHPLNNDVRTEITNKIFEAYEEFIEEEK